MLDIFAIHVKIARYELRCEMDEFYRLNLLFDFYGDLLTEKQYDIFSKYVNEDLTVSEIARLKDISRQGIHDSIRRSEATLEEYEEKLGLVQKFETAKERLYGVIETVTSLEIEPQVKERLSNAIRDIIDEW